MPETEADDGEKKITVSANAAKRISELVGENGNLVKRLRIAISSGGCSGFQYGFSIDDQRREDDRIFERSGIQVVVDEVSLNLLDGAELDYVEDLIGSYFALKNPQASSSCGCGSSFAV
ncbi:MAG TPA: iron-sulfur cluster insertion protein ErpA [Rhodospirillales bacterium]|jgi:iron-sulfur cluster insertion protein|nr:iron-sulfur cluster insertion protein ErpA [Rhodospirillales bacterium]